jgi:formylglycine-generating enzyme required for sulfatase activity/serine/threonine protein kinase
MSEAVHRNSLQAGFKLHWYTIESILGQGGFGITYLAKDSNLNQSVAIKEYLPIELAVREGDHSVHPVSEERGDQYSWGLERFVTEAQTLAQFKHPNIVRVLTVFTANNTAYMVMEYESGESLQQRLSQRRTLEQPELLNLLLPIMGGLEKVHEAGFIHRDIKPANIFVRSDGSPVLLDFGSARQALGAETRTLTSLVSPGYAPFEQYVSKSDKQGPWTDIYGLGATLYRAITGRAPADAVDRSEALLQQSATDVYVAGAELGKGRYSQRFLAAIDHALCFQPQDRPQTIKQWRDEFGVPAVLDASTVAASSVPVVDEADVKTRFEPVDPVSEATTVLSDEAVLPVDRLSFFKRKRKWIYSGVGLFILLAILGEEETSDQGAANGNEKTADVGGGYSASDDPSAEGADDETTRELLRLASEDIDKLRLTSPAGENAFERYQQILEREPRNIDAQMGMHQIVDKYVELIDEAVADKKFDTARRHLQRGLSVLAEEPRLLELKALLDEDRPAKKDAEVSSVEKGEISPLISREDRRTLQRYRKILKKDPNNLNARRGVRRLVEKLFKEVRTAVERKQYDRAEAYINVALALEPGNARLKEALTNLESLRRGKRLRPGSLFRDQLSGGASGPELVVVPAGDFRMGSMRRKRDSFAGEHPIRKVTVSKPFAIGAREVTRQEFGAFVTAARYRTEAERNGVCSYFENDDWKIDKNRSWRSPGFEQTSAHPVVCVAWNDVQAYLRWLSEQAQEIYRLPSEAEWEYAARGGKKAPYPWGSRVDRECRYANLMDYNDENGGTYFKCNDEHLYTSPVAKFSANTYGLYDTIGNVLELTADCLYANYRARGDTQARTKGDCSGSMLRGGAWSLPRGKTDDAATVTTRIPWPRNYRSYMVGFRVLREVRR